MDAKKGQDLPTRAAFWVGLSLLVLVLLWQLRALVLRAAAPLPHWLVALLALPLCLACFGLPFLLLKNAGHATGYTLHGGRSRAPLWVLLPLFMGVVVAANSVVSVLQTLAGALFGAPAATAAPLPQAGGELLLHFLLLCVLSPLMEELYFRGAMQQWLHAFGRRFALLLSALAFTLLHTGWWQLPTVLVLGLALGYVYEVSHSVWACVALHAANNTVAFLLQLARERMPTDAGFALTLWLMILLVALFIAAVWAVRHFKLGRKLWLKRDKPELGSRGARLLRLLKAPPFLLGAAALVAQFVLGVVT